MIGRADAVGLLADLPATLRMNNDLNAGIAGAHLVDVLGQKALMHRAVPLPQDDFGFAQPFEGLAALQHVGIPHHHFVQRNTAGEAGVAAQVLVGKEEELFVAAEAQSNAPLALDEVQTSPPRSPQNALMAAVEFM